MIPTIIHAFRQYFKNCSKSWLSMEFSGLSRKNCLPVNFYPRTKIFSKRIKNICHTLKIFVLLACCIEVISRSFHFSWTTNLLLQLLHLKRICFASHMQVHIFKTLLVLCSQTAYMRLTHFGIDLVYFHSSAINTCS